MAYENIFTNSTVMVNDVFLYHIVKTKLEKCHTLPYNSLLFFLEGPIYCSTRLKKSVICRSQ